MPINGTNLSETIFGTASADTIRGYFGSDTIYGGAGDDLIFGDSWLSGGAGGSEVRLNQTTAGNQSEVQLISLSDGRMLAIWNSDTSQTLTGDWDLQSGVVTGRYLDATGQPLGAEFAISAPGVLAYGFQNWHAFPSTMTQLANGDVVVAWTEGSMNAGHVAARILHSDGTMSSSFVLTTDNLGSWQTAPALSPTADGGFRLVYQVAHGPGEDGYGVWTRSFDASGSATSASVLVNTYTDWDQGTAQMVQLADGGHIVVWNSLQQGESDVPGGDFHAADVYFQRYDAQGAPVGGERLVNTGYSLGTQGHPNITSLADGGFIVVWQSQAQDGDGDAVVSRRFDANGVGGPEVIVNETTADSQNRPRVVALAQGGYVVVWQSQAQDGDQAGIVFRCFDDNGNGGPEMQANVESTGRQMIASVTAMDFDHGGFVIAWTSADGHDGAGSGIYARSFDMNGLALSHPGDDSLRGGLGNDGLYGQQGDDSLFGDAGNDFLDGGTGEDVLNGGTDRDTLSGDDGQDKLYGSDGNDSLHGGNDNDSVYGGNGNDILIGGQGDDTVSGGVGNDKVHGAAGKDRVYGGDGDDSLYGHTGNDLLYGGNGVDRMFGGAGRDVMKGGAGADDFVFASVTDTGLGTARDVITDFTHLVDDIDLSAFSGIFSFIGSGAFSGSGMQLRYSAATGIIQGNLTNDVTADFEIKVTPGTVLTAADFIL